MSAHPNVRPSLSDSAGIEFRQIADKARSITEGLDGAAGVRIRRVRSRATTAMRPFRPFRAQPDIAAGLAGSPSVTSRRRLQNSLPSALCRSLGHVFAMQVASAVTVASPAGANEDVWRTGDSFALVLDGAGRYPGESGGCIHPVTWVVSQLADHLERPLRDRSEAPIAGLVRQAILGTMSAHGDQCDLTDPLSPGAAGAVVRLRDGFIEWFVLGDCAVVVECRDGRTAVVIDDRVDRLRDAPITDAAVRTYAPAFVATRRNQPDGFWVLAAVPAAADQGMTGRIQIVDVARVLICSDGISRLVERYGASWTAVLDRAQSGGVEALVADVRAAEHADPDPRRWRGKRHDDATAVLLRPVHHRR
jgi:hypothetical protein